MWWHTRTPDFVFRRNERVHLNRRGLQFSRLLAAQVCASAVVMLDTPCSEAVWRVLATHSIRQFPLHFPSRAPPCAITFQLDSNIGMLRVTDMVMQNKTKSTPPLPQRSFTRHYTEVNRADIVTTLLQKIVLSHFSGLAYGYLIIKVQITLVLDYTQ